MNRARPMAARLKITLSFQVSPAWCGLGLTPWSEQKSLTPQGNNNMNFRLARD